MGAPASNGRLCTKLSEMLIGDYIKCEYVASTANVAGEFKNLGLESNELSGLSTNPATTANGYLYFIKADKGLLIADRLVQQSISGQALKNKGYLTGTKTDLGLIRCLSRAEFLKYISNSDLNGNIIRQDVNVWHCTAGTASTSFRNVYLPIELNTDRSAGYINASLFADGSLVNTTGLFSTSLDGYGWATCPISQKMGDTIINFGRGNGAYICFRPALEYIDNTKSTNIWK